MGNTLEFIRVQRKRLNHVGGWCAVWVVFCAGVAWAELNTGRPTTALGMVAVSGEHQPAPAVMARLEAALLQQDYLALVERQQLERILAEQQLTAAAIMDPRQRVRLGQLVPADLLIFLDSVPKLPKPATRVQVAESKTGIVLASQIFVNEPLQQDPQPVIELLRAAIAKRAVPLKDRHVLGYLEFRSEESGPMLDGAAAALGTLVVTDLARAPHVIVLEREHLQHLEIERELTAVEQELRTSVRLLEGGIHRAADTNQFVVTVSLRPLAKGEPLTTTVTVPAADPVRAEALISEQIAGLLKTQRAEPGISDRPREAALYAGQALLWRAWGDKPRAVHAAETAYALDSSQTNRLLLASTLVYTNSSLREAMRGNENLLDYYRLHRIALAAGSETNYTLPFLGYRTELAPADPDGLRQELQRLEDAVFRAQLDHYAQYYDQTGVSYWKVWTQRLYDLPYYHPGHPQDQAGLVREAAKAFVQPPGRPEWVPCERLEIFKDLPFLMWPDGRPYRRPLFTDEATKEVFHQVLRDMTVHADPYIRLVGYRSTEKLLGVGFFMARRSVADKLEMYRCREAYLRILTEEIKPDHPYRAGHCEGFMNHGRSNEGIALLADVGAWRYGQDMPAWVFDKERGFARQLLEGLIAPGDWGRFQAQGPQNVCWLLERVAEYGNPKDALALTDQILALGQASPTANRWHIQELQKLRPRFERMIAGTTEAVAKKEVPANDPGWGDYVIRPLDWKLTPPFSHDPQIRSSVLMVSRGNRLYCVVPTNQQWDRINLQLTTHWLPSGAILASQEVPVGIPATSREFSWKTWMECLHALALGGDGRLYAGTRAGLIAMSPDSNRWERITSKEGLPGTVVRSVAWHDGKVYVGIGCDPYTGEYRDQAAFAAYDPQTKTCEIIASEKGVGKRNAWDGTAFTLDHILSDPEHDCLWLRDRRQGIWKYQPQTRTLEKVNTDRPRPLLEGGGFAAWWDDWTHNPSRGDARLVRPRDASTVLLPGTIDGTEVRCDTVIAACDGENVFYAGQLFPEHRWVLVLLRPNQKPAVLRQQPNGKPYAGAFQLHAAAAGIVAVSPDGTAILIQRKGKEAEYRATDLQAASGQPRETELLDAAEAGRLDDVRRLVASGVDINATDRHGWTSLHYALDRKRVDAARFLIEHGADVRRPTEAGCEPLAFAAARNEVVLVEELLKRGAEVNPPTKFCFSPLAAAALQGATEALHLLVARGAEVNWREPAGRGNTILMSAAFAGQLESVRALLDHHADLEGTDFNGNTALMCAAVAGQTNVLSFLAKKGAQVNAKNRHGSTALMQVAEAGQLGSVQALLQAGADPNARNHHATPLMLAVESSHIDTIRALLQAHADVNALNDMAEPALFDAAFHQKHEIMKLLLDAGAAVIIQRPGQPPMDLIDYAQSVDGRALLRQALKKQQQEGRNGE